MDKGWGTVGVYRAIEPQACISTFPCCMISLLQNLFLLEKVILLFPLFFPCMYSLCLPIVPHSCSVHMVLCLRWDQTLNYKSYIFSNYFIHLCMWLSSQLKPNSDWHLSLLLIERYKEAASDWLSEMSPSYQELVFCQILPTRLLKFEEYEMLQSSQMAHVKGEGDGGLFWSGVIFSRYLVFWMEGFVSCIDSLWSWKQKQPTKMSVKS